MWIHFLINRSSIAGVSQSVLSSIKLMEVEIIIYNAKYRHLQLFYLKFIFHIYWPIIFNMVILVNFLTAKNAKCHGHKINSPFLLMSPGISPIFRVPRSKPMEPKMKPHRYHSLPYGHFPARQYSPSQDI